MDPGCGSKGFIDLEAGTRAGRVGLSWYWGLETGIQDVAGKGQNFPGTLLQKEKKIKNRKTLKPYRTY